MKSNRDFKMRRGKAQIWLCRKCKRKVKLPYSDRLCDVWYARPQIRNY